jgi:hypothetical protein
MFKGLLKRRNIAKFLANVGEAFASMRKNAKHAVVFGEWGNA